METEVSRRLKTLQSSSNDGTLAVAVGVLFEPKKLAQAHNLLKNLCSTTCRIVIGTSSTACLDDWQIADLLNAGAQDIFEFGRETIDVEAKRLGHLLDRWLEVDDLVEQASAQGDLVGQSVCWLTALRRAVEAAKGSSRALLIRGETGTGKEAVARMIHQLGNKGDRPLVPVDCAASVDSLFAAELFGHRKGAFTGAVQDRDGALARAHGGTLFLDELGELRPVMQASLLRVLQERAYIPVGASEARLSQFRLISATHRHLEHMVESGEFRRDLYHRVAEADCELPPLRDRRKDIPLLLRHFLAQCGLKEVTIDGRVERWLDGLPWLGNVRQLRSVATAIASRMHGSPEVKLSHLPRSLLGPGPCSTDGTQQQSKGLRDTIQQAVSSGTSLNQILDTVRDEAVRAAIELAGGKSAEAAARLGVSERMIQLRRRGWVHSVAVAADEPEPTTMATNAIEVG